jgi:osmotically-inducible protein OsmY
MTRNQDERIKKWVVDQLYWDSRVDASHVRVETSNGNVMLTGTVAGPHAREAAESDAFDIPGVQGVQNKLTVSEKEEMLAEPSDAKLKEDIERFFWANPVIDASKVSVLVEGGMVTLQGFVKAPWKRLMAEKVAEIPGVQGIENMIAVQV